MKKNYVFVLGDAVSNYIFDDLKKNPNTVLIKNMYSWKNPAAEFFYLLHCGKTTNQHFEMPFRSIWLRFSALGKIKFCREEETVLFFTNPTLRYIDTHTLKKWSKDKHIKLALIYYDTLDKEASRIANRMRKKVDFDYIFTYDKEDAQKYGFQYVECLYSKFDVTEDPVTSDLFFAGTNKGRLHELVDIYEYLEKQGCVCNFTINQVPEEEMVHKDKIQYNQLLEYPELVQKFQSSGCILEVLQEGQHGITLRTYEAVCYGKKLLTNNPDIVNFQFYDPRYMKYFTSVKDIDLKWLTGGEQVIYSYQDEFSPLHLLEYL